MPRVPTAPADLEWLAFSVPLQPLFLTSSCLYSQDGPDKEQPLSQHPKLSLGREDGPCAAIHIRKGLTFDLNVFALFLHLA